MTIEVNNIQKETFNSLNLSEQGMHADTDLRKRRLINVKRH